MVNIGLIWYSCLRLLISDSWYCIIVYCNRWRLLQYTAPILYCFPRHWAPILAGSCLTPWWWHFKVPKHVGEYWVPIHWMFNAFVCFIIHLKITNYLRSHKERVICKFFHDFSNETFLHREANYLLRVLYFFFPKYRNPSPSPTSHSHILHILWRHCGVYVGKIKSQNTEWRDE
jgi:hypothetical protein